MKVIFYLTKANIIDFVDLDGLGRYSGKTKEQLEVNHGPLVIIDEEEAYSLTAARILAEDEAYELERDSFRVPAKEVDADRYQDMLEVLPPCKWHRVSGNVSVFHVSERMAHDIVSWFFEVGHEPSARYFELQDSENLSDKELLEAIASIL